MRASRKGATVVVWGLLAGSVVLGQDFPDGTDGELYYAPRIDLIGLVVELDGQLDEEAWQRASFQVANGILETPPDSASDADFRWAAVADDEFLYVAVEVTDDIPQAGADLHTICDVWMDDSVEIYLDALNDGPECPTLGTNCYRADDAQLTVGRENAGLGDAELLQIAGLAGSAACDFTEPAPDLCRGVVVETDNGWRAEIAVGLETEGNLDVLGVPDGTPTWSIEPGHGCRIGFSIQVNDDDDGGGRDTKLLWALSEVAGGEAAWRDPGVFGKLVFIDPSRSLPRDPVGALTCNRNPDGTLALTWENPAGAEPPAEIRILVDGAEETSVPGTATSATLTEEQVPQDGRNHTISVDNGTCTPATCFLRQSGFDDCGAIRFWNLLGAYGPSGVGAGPDALRQDYMTDGIVSEDEFIWLPGQTISTSFGQAAASTTYNDSLGNATPTVQAFEGNSGYVDFQTIFNNQENVMAYAQCYVLNDTGSDLEVWWADSSDDSIQVKLNGSEAWNHDEGRGAPNSCQSVEFPQDVSPDGLEFFDPLVLEAGENSLLVKVFNGCCGWNFIGRFQDADGNPVTDGLRISLFPTGVVPPVLNLTCERQEDRSVVLNWANPAGADSDAPISILVDGAEADSVPGTAAAATLTEAQVPRDGRDHIITVVNSSGVGTSCRLKRDTAFAPPELQAEGGELYVNAGGSDVTDLVDRTWHADPLYLAPDQPDTNAANFAGQFVDLNLLDDSEAPEDVFLSERWCDCAIHYQMEVPNGDYRVILYFSENCTGCVSANLGGTSADANAARIFDIEVEDERVDSYNQADAAIPPRDDGAGATFVATEVSFDVQVSDELLDIRILDQGAGNPPENAAVKAFAIEREGFVPERFRRGDANADAQVNITDAIYLLSSLFLGGPPPPCPDASDTNDDSAVNITDAIFLLSSLFLGGPPPPLPGTSTCGSDPSPDQLGPCNDENC